MRRGYGSTGISLISIVQQFKGSTFNALILIRSQDSFSLLQRCEKRSRRAAYAPNRVAKGAFSNVEPLNVELLNYFTNLSDVQFFRAIIIMTRAASGAFSREQLVDFSYLIGC